MTQPEEALEAQREYCRSKGIPNFAGSGKCTNCNRVIFDAISVKQAASELITGCPYCHKSFVE